MYPAKQNRRKAQGAAIAEFGAAFLVLVVFLFIPLVNLSFIGVRFFIAQGAMQEFAHRLALAEKRSESYSMLASDDWWKNFCNSCGANISNPQLKLLVCSADGTEQISLSSVQDVPGEWLPGGAKGPCVYTYELSADIEVPPIYSGAGPAIPGLSAPIPFKLSGRSAWENLSRDPATTEYFVNE